MATTFEQRRERQGPPEFATEFPIGTIRQGNDGRLWKVVPANGSQRWSRLAAKDEERITSGAQAQAAAPGAARSPERYQGGRRTIPPGPYPVWTPGAGTARAPTQPYPLSRLQQPIRPEQLQQVPSVQAVQALQRREGGYLLPTQRSATRGVGPSPALGTDSSPSPPHPHGIHPSRGRSMGAHRRGAWSDRG